MDFRIADTFTDSLARLTPDEQKAIKTTAFDLQMNPMTPGMSFHALTKARDKNFHSIRINDDIRLIVHRTDASFLLCYVDHHDKAYDWAQRRKLEVHPKTGAAQLVEVRERVEEIVIPRYVEGPAAPLPEAKPKPPLFAGFSDDKLLSYGVPPDWIAEVKSANEDTLLEIAERLPREASEALLELATGSEPKSAPVAPQGANPFEHPDALRRFRVMADVDELKAALDFPWDKWTVFLHPAQRQLVERDYSGPARVSGSAGTGKTIVALHRAVFLAKRSPESRTLLATFSDTLANALHDRLRRLLASEPRLAERMEVGALNAVAERLYVQQFGKAKFAGPGELGPIIGKAIAEHPQVKLSAAFIASEWWEIVDANQVATWEAYRDVKRLGRKTRLSEKLRLELWSVFEQVNRDLAAGGWVTYAGVFSALASRFKATGRPPFDFVVIDEAQDITPMQLSFVATIAGAKPDGLFFAGDLGQRIFQLPFSWKAAGVDIRGRSRTLTVNYRTSHQIRQRADRLLGPEVSDIDGNTETRKGTVSIFNGPDPLIRRLSSQAQERDEVAKWIKDISKQGVAAHEIGVIVRSEAELGRATDAIAASGLHFRVIDTNSTSANGKVCVCTMHLAKGLEFRSVAVMACDDDIVPLQERIDDITDEADLAEVYATERHLLYVAITRARDHLLITSGGPASEFLDDLS
jgi:mRNA-degrading endonuclease RelE of RelBE toxin-antitoxin system